MNWFSELRSLEFTSSFMFMAAFLLLAAFVAWSMYGPELRGGKSRAKGRVPLASARESIIPEDRAARIAKTMRFVSLVVLSGLIAAMVAVPGSTKTEMATSQEKVTEQSKGLVVFDTSGSVTGSVFEAGQDFMVYFLERQEENMQGKSQIGVSFYSAFEVDDLFMYRTPTSDLETLAYDLSKLSMERARDPMSGESLFGNIAGPTNTTGALYEAARKLKAMEEEDEDLEGLTIILVVDVHPERGSRAGLDDTIENMAEVIEEIMDAEINVYIASITAGRKSEQVMDTFDSLLGSNPRFEIFDVLGAESKEEIEEIAAAISEMETKRFTSTEVIISSTEKEISRELAAIVLLAATLFILFSEVLARRSRGYYSDLRKKEKLPTGRNKGGKK